MRMSLSDSERIGPLMATMATMTALVVGCRVSRGVKPF